VSARGVGACRRMPQATSSAVGKASRLTPTVSKNVPLYVGKASRFTLVFGRFQTPGGPELGLWPEAPGKISPGFTLTSANLKRCASMADGFCPGGYGLICAGVRTDSMIGVTKLPIRQDGAHLQR
jgi:hypothetical protein